MSTARGFRQDECGCARARRQRSTERLNMSWQKREGDVVEGAWCGLVLGQWAHDKRLGGWLYKDAAQGRGHGQECSVTWVLSATVECKRERMHPSLGIEWEPGLGALSRGVCVIAPWRRRRWRNPGVGADQHGSPGLRSICCAQGASMA